MQVAPDIPQSARGGKVLLPSNSSASNTQHFQVHGEELKIVQISCESDFNSREKPSRLTVVQEEGEDDVVIQSIRQLDLQVNNKAHFDQDSSFNSNSPAKSPFKLSPQSVADRDRATSENSSDGMFKAGKEEVVCKICFEESSDKNVLLSPCLCHGSVKYTHETCLKTWLSSKKEDIRAASCEICQAKFKMEFKTKQKMSCNSSLKSCGSHFAYPFAVFLLSAGVILVLLTFKSKLAEQGKSSSQILLAITGVIAFFGALVVAILTFNAIKATCFIDDIYDWKILNYNDEQETTANQTQAQLLESIPEMESHGLQPIFTLKIDHLNCQKINVKPRLKVCEQDLNTLDTIHRKSLSIDKDTHIEFYTSKNSFMTQRGSPISRRKVSDMISTGPHSPEKSIKTCGFRPFIPSNTDLASTFTDLYEVKVDAEAKHNAQISPFNMKVLQNVDTVETLKSRQLIEKVRRGLQVEDYEP